MAADIIRAAGLDALSTFRLPARAHELVVIEDAQQLPGALETDLPALVLGGGSNTLFVEDFPGRVLINRIGGISSELIEFDRVRITAGAGENWHELVLWTLDRGLWGLENLALIPGSVGAAPMQNIGAYGVELAHCLDAVQVYDRQSGQLDWMAATECGLGYRSSRFKGPDAGRFVIVAVRLELQLHGTPILDYPSLAADLERHGHPRPDDPRTIAASVMRIRKHKLPDPARVANAGSFFKNPVVQNQILAPLLERYPELPNWPDRAGTVKLSAGWLIDQLGWRGRSIGGAAVYENHALVLVNRGDATGRDVLELARQIKSSVRDEFGIELEPEPMVVGGTI